MTTDITELGFTHMLAAHLSRMPALVQVINRTDQALLCRTKGGQTFMVLVTGPGEEKAATENTKSAENGERKTEDGKAKKVTA